MGRYGVDKKRIVTIFLVLFLILTTSLLWAASGSKKIAIFPFKINAPKEMSFLSQGLMDMLETRLNDPGTIDVVDSSMIIGKINQLKQYPGTERAKRIARSFGANYLLLGTLTWIGNKGSIDIRLYKLVGKEKPLNFFTKLNSEDEIIPIIDSLSKTIKNRLGGRRQLLKPSVQAPLDIPTGTPSGSGTLQEALSRETPVFSYLMRLPFEVVRMEWGDIDGDGQNELIVLGTERLACYKSVKGDLQRFIGYKRKKEGNFIHVSIADLNHNKIPEIFISWKKEYQVGTTILEFVNGRLRTITKNLPFFVGVVRHPQKGKMVIAQKRNITTPFTGKLYRVEFINGRYKLGKKLKLPRTCKVYNFSFMKMAKTLVPKIAYLSDSDYLVVADVGGEKIYVSNKRFGGSLNTIPYFNPEGDPGYQKLYYYIPLRVISTDLNNDGQDEIIITENESLTHRITEQFRTYTEGKIHVLKWTGMGLRKAWSTPRIKGYVSDYIILDINGDGQRELLVSSVEKRLVKHPRTRIFLYPLR